MKLLYLAMLLTLLYSCGNTKKLSNKMEAIQIFREVITGDFDNSKQIAEEIAAGKQIHPNAKHINRVFTRIQNLPWIVKDNNKDLKNFFILEESYYTYPGKLTDIKPYLFYFSAKGADSVQLTVYQVPANWKKEEIRNDNPDFKLNFAELRPSPTFKGATYFYDREKKVFTTNSVNDLGNGMTFTLTETLSLQQLIVMELLVKDGKQLTPYSTPIIYERR